MHPLLDQVSFWVALTMLGSAAITDFRTGLIPNAIVSCGGVAGVLVQLLAAGFGRASVVATLASMGLGLSACSIVPGVLYAAGALGGGDLKLLAALGLCVGPVVGLDIQLCAYLWAAAWLPLYFLCHAGARRALRTSGVLVLNAFLPIERRAKVDRAQLTSMRFAPAIFAAAVWVGWFGGVLP